MSGRRIFLIALAAVIAWPGALLLVGYSGARDNNRNSYRACLEGTAVRYADALADDADYTRELVLAARSKGVVAEAHQGSADAHKLARDEKLARTAQTAERRAGYCRRLYPPPSVLPFARE